MVEIWKRWRRRAKKRCIQRQKGEVLYVLPHEQRAREWERGDLRWSPRVAGSRPWRVTYVVVRGLEFVQRQYGVIENIRAVARSDLSGEGICVGEGWSECYRNPEMLKTWTKAEGRVWREESMRRRLDEPGRLHGQEGHGVTGVSDDTRALGFHWHRFQAAPGLLQHSLTSPVVGKTQLTTDDDSFAPTSLLGRKDDFVTPSWSGLQEATTALSHSRSLGLPLSCLLSLGPGSGYMGLVGNEGAGQALMGIWWLISSVYCSENEVTSPFAWQLIDGHFLSICRVDVLFCEPSCLWAPSGF